MHVSSFDIRIYLCCCDRDDDHNQTRTRQHIIEAHNTAVSNGLKVGYILVI